MPPHDRPPQRHARSRRPRAASIVDVGGVGYDVLVPLSTFYVLGEPGAAVTLRIHTHVREDVDRALRVRHAARAGSVRAADRDQRHRPEAGAGGAVRHRAGGADPRDPHAGRRAADRDSRRRQEDRRADRARAEGSAAARRSQAAEPAPAASTPGDQLRDDLLSALINLGYQRPVGGEGARQGRCSGSPTRAFEQALQGRALRRADEGLTSMTDDRLVTAGARRRRRPVRGGAAAADARRVHRPGPRAREPPRRRSPRRSSAARRSITCCSTARPGSARRRWRT